jgi:hypothetical protein
MTAGPSYVLTAHAAKVIAGRGIALGWIERVLASPAKLEDDRRDPTLRMPFFPSLSMATGCCE